MPALNSFSSHLINAAVSMNRRNTELEVCLHWCQKLKLFASVESDGIPPWLGSD